MRPTFRSGSTPASSVSAARALRADARLVDSQHRPEILIALPALEQELQHCLLVRRQGHAGKRRDSGSGGRRSAVGGS